MTRYAVRAAARLSMFSVCVCVLLWAVPRVTGTNWFVREIVFVGLSPCCRCCFPRWGTELWREADCF